MTTERRISVCDGKYTFVLPLNDYRVHVLRQGDPWIVIEQGCNAIWSLVAETIDDRKLVDAVYEYTTTTGCSPRFRNLAYQNLLEAVRRHAEERGEKPIPQWRTNTPPRGVRCLVTAPHPKHDGALRVFVATLSPDYDGHCWFGDGTRIHGVIA